jgi:hypothetical protein
VPHLSPTTLTADEQRLILRATAGIDSQVPEPPETGALLFAFAGRRNAGLDFGLPPPYSGRRNLRGPEYQ